MPAVTISSKYQIVIPVSVREALDLTPGEKLEFVLQGKTAHLVRVPTLASLRGLLAGSNFEDVRDRSDLEVSPLP
jgi:AbrB family looped-hinge helix DNA binding protein